MTYICIEGNIGSGKTTLVQQIATFNGVQPILEQFSENPFLKLFYENPDTHAFPLEMSFLAERFQQLNQIFSAPDIFKVSYVADYSFIKCLIFASQTLKPEEFHVFQHFYKILRNQIPQPDCIYYLHNSPSDLLKNIEARGRSFEKKIDHAYLERIERAYSERLLGSFKSKIVHIYNYNSLRHRSNELAEAIFFSDIEVISRFSISSENT